MAAQIRKRDLGSVVGALTVIVNGEMRGEKVHRFRVRPKVQWTLGRALRELQPRFEQLQRDHQELFKVYGDGETIPKERMGEYREGLDALLVETVECPYTVTLADVDMDPEAPIGALGELITE